MDQFRQGLRNDVKDLLLTFHDDPKSLTEAISWSMRCDNHLFERRSNDIEDHYHMLKSNHVERIVYAYIVDV